MTRGGDTRIGRVGAPGPAPPAPVESERSVPIAAPPAVAADPYAGFQFGSYVIDRKLGQGAMGVVYRLRHREAELFKVVKFLRPTPNEEIVKRFHQEFSVAAALPSYYVVKPDDFGQLADGTYFFVMEYLPGRTLEQELASGALPVKDALQIGTRLADAVAELDEYQVVHRDLKPANVILYQVRDRDRRIKLLDFGVAKVRGTRKEVGTAHDQCIGTLGYMPPEGVGAQHEVDARFDVFSLGALLYEMLTGRLPFEVKPDLADTLRAMFGSEPSPIYAATDNAALLRDVDAVVRRALARRPSERPRPAELHQALDALYRRLIDEANQSASAVPTRMPTLLTGGPRHLTPEKSPTLVNPVDVEAMLARAQVPTTAAPPVSVSAQARTQPALAAPVAARWAPTQPALAARAPARRDVRARRLRLMILAVGVACVAGLVFAGIWFSRRPPPAPIAQQRAAPPKATRPVELAPMPVAMPAAVTPQETPPETRPKRHTANVKHVAASPPPDVAPVPEHKPMNDTLFNPFGAK